MVDYIGPLALNRVSAYTKTGRNYRISGDMASQATMDQLEELFALVEGGTAIHSVPGGRQVGEDNNDDHRNTYLCQFDEEDLPDGYYLLRPGFARKEDGPIFWSFTANLFYMGSKAQQQPGLQVKSIEDVTNDWSIKGALENALPVGASDVKIVKGAYEYPIDIDVHGFTRTGKDGAEKILRLFGGDENQGEYTEPLWRKGWDAGLTAPNGIVNVTDATMEMKGLAAVAGVYGDYFHNSQLPIPLMDELEVTVAMLIPTDDTGGVAARDIQQYFYLKQDRDEVDPDDDNNSLLIYADVDESGILYYVKQEVNGTRSTLFDGSDYTEASGRATGDLEATIWRLVFHEGHDGAASPNDVRHLHIYLKQSDTLANAELATENQLDDSPYDISAWLFNLAYLCHRIASQDNTNYFDTGDEGVFDYARITYPTEGFKLKCKVAAANELLGACEIWDGDPDGAGVQVFDEDHVFSGDPYIQNGLLRLHVDEGVSIGLKLSYYTGATWSEMSRLRTYLRASAKYTTFPYLMEVMQYSTETIKIRVKLHDTATEDDDYTSTLDLTLRRGRHYIEINEIKSYPLQDTALLTYVVNLRFGWACDGDVADADLSVEATNTTLTDNFMMVFDDEGAAVLVFMASSEKPDAAIAQFAVSVQSLTMQDFLVTTLTDVKAISGIIPFALIANTFKEAESATISSAARSNLDGDGVDTVTENDGVWAATLNCAVDENNGVENSVGAACVDIASSAAGAVEATCTPAAPLGNLSKFDDLKIYFHGNPNGSSVNLRLIDADGDSLFKSQAIGGSATEYTIALPHSDSDLQGWVEVGTFVYTTFTTLRIEWIAAAGGEHVYVDGVRNYIGTTTARGRGETLSGGSAVVLYLNTHQVFYDITCGTDLPVGRYLGVVRMKCTDEAAVSWKFAYIDALPQFRNQENSLGSLFAATTSFAYYLILFDITQDDVDNTRTLSAPKIYKGAAAEDTLFIDYFLNIPLGEGESGPMDLAHSALKTRSAPRRVFAL